MKENPDFLRMMREENWRHAYLAEEKRALTANVVLIVAAASQMVISVVGLTGRFLPLTITLIIVGGYGMVVTTKLYERSQFHILRARKLRTRLGELYPDAQVDQLQQSAEREHFKRYPIFMRIRLNAIWFGLSAIVAGAGIAETILCLN